MKNLISLCVLLLIGTLNSCSYNQGINLENPGEKFAADQYPQKWKLIEMSGNVANVPPSTGNDMAWQEYYLLYSDSTFVKSRKKENVTSEETGHYSFVTLTDGKYLELSYESDNDLVGNCTSEAKEILRLNAADNELIGTWSACDGPGLIYERVE